MNDLIVAILVGLLLSLSAGVRLTIPLLVVAVLAYEHLVKLPQNLAWIGTQSSLILLSVAFVVETLVHFIPAAGTAMKAAATPLAFVAGTLLMAIPLGDRNPLYQWILAGAMGGGTATLAHLGFTGLRAATGPVNVASGGIFGIGWNVIEILGSIFFILVGWICVAVGWVAGLAVLLVVGIGSSALLWKLVRRVKAGTRWFKDAPLPTESV